MSHSSDIAIQVEGLGKMYRIGRREKRADTVVGRLRQALNSPFQWLESQMRPPNEDEIFWALRDVSFDVRQGETVGIVGSNGAGKSTLLKILSSITEPTEGQARIRGRVGSLLEVGTGMHKELTGRENIYMNGAVLGMRKEEIDRKFDEIVEFSGIGKFIDTPIKRYSSGMNVRLGFAVAAHLEPEILVVDEVLAVGDAEFRKKCLGKMSEVSHEGRTVLFVSHNMAAVANICSRCLLIREGRLVADDKPPAIIDQYLQGAQQGRREEAPGVFDLSERTNNYEDGKIVIRRVRLFDENNRLSSIFPMGRPMRIEVAVEGMSDFNDTQIGVTFIKNDGTWLGSINTVMNCTGIQDPRTKREVAVLNVEELPFTPNQYYLAVSVIRSHGRIDYAERAATFTVAEDDVYGTGRQIAAQYGVIYIKGAWSIQNDSPDNSSDPE